MDGKAKYAKETFPSATLSTRDPTRLVPVSNPGLRSGKPAANRLSYGTVKDGGGYISFRTDEYFSSTRLYSTISRKRGFIKAANLNSNKKNSNCKE
jgi:hypothetical protein